jgi:glycosyltransferase involved in cell wall biosynthesis
LKTAVVHDWSVGYAGSERCVESFLNIWSDADVFMLFAFLKEDERKIILKDKKLNTSFLQNWNSVKRNHRNYLALFPYAIEQFDLLQYDLIISSSHAIAKGILTNPNQLHICYCHTPIRYAWDLYHQYLNESKLNKGIKGTFAKAILHYIRMWDLSTTNRVDYFIANSVHTSKRIKKIYNRDSEVIHPPIDIKKFNCEGNKDEFYLTLSRLVPYKKTDLIVDAFSKLSDKKLIVIGDGPEMEKIKSKAGKNIEILGYQNFPEMKNYMEKAKAFVFAGEEDFGIVLVEALSCGTPVIALNRGGAAEIIENGVNGLLFEEQNVESIINAINEFEKTENNFIPLEIAESSKKFSREIFEEKIKSFVDKKSQEFFGK